MTKLLAYRHKESGALRLSNKGRPFASEGGAKLALGTIIRQQLRCSPYPSTKEGWAAAYKAAVDSLELVPVVLIPQEDLDRLHDIADRYERLSR